MRFEHKIFLTSFSLAAFVCSLAAISIYSSVKNHMIEDYHTRYQVLASTVGNTLSQLDKSSDKLLKASLFALSEQVKGKSELPSNEDLKRLREAVGLSSIDIVRNDGEFVRSSSFPEYGSYNLFGYCDSYRDLFNGKTQLVSTPVMPSSVFGKGIKFSLLSLPGLKYALNVGFELNFIGQTLANAFAADANIRAIGLYTPSGKKLGDYTTGKACIISETPERIAKTPIVTEQGDLLKITFRVDPSSTVCCECAHKGLVTAGQDYFYVLKMMVSLEPLVLAIKNVKFTILGILAFALFLSLLLSKVVARALVVRIMSINQKAGAIIESKQLSGRLEIDGQDEISDLGKRFDAMLATLEEAQSELVASEKEKTFALVARQVSHDIRSPLTALQHLLSQVSNLPEPQRQLAKAAVGRITDIANTLLSRARQADFDSVDSESSNGDLKPQHLPAIVESIVSEKRMAYRDSAGIQIDTNLRNAYGAFARVDASELKRVISNLINNAIEAYKDGKGKVTVNIERTDSVAVIRIADQGHGIPEPVLQRLGEKRLSYGKCGNDSGLGLGIFHCKKTVERFGGKFEILSKEGAGTIVSIFLPSAKPPAWFVENLRVPVPGVVVSLDDEQGIHNIWADRLALLGHAENGGRHLSCTSASDFANLFGRIKKDLNYGMMTKLYLVDFELLDQNLNGIDLIRQFEIANQTVLVTSRYDEPSIQEQCEQLGVKIIPKDMAPFIPIEIVSIYTNQTPSESLDLNF